MKNIKLIFIFEYKISKKLVLSNVGHHDIFNTL